MKHRNCFLLRIFLSFLHSVKFYKTGFNKFHWDTLSYFLTLYHVPIASIGPATWSYFINCIRCGDLMKKIGCTVSRVRCIKLSQHQRAWGKYMGFICPKYHLIYWGGVVGGGGVLEFLKLK